MRGKLIFVIVIFFSMATLTKAGLIEIPPSAGGHLISAHSPIGQSFIAEDPEVIIGLYIIESSVFKHPDLSLLVQLYQGEGVSGQLLDSRTMTPLAGFEGYLDINYCHIELNPGSSYSVTLSADNPRWVSKSSWEQYSGGSAIITGILCPELHDKAFRITPIPEPATILLIGLGGLFLRKRRRR